MAPINVTIGKRNSLYGYEETTDANEGRPAKGGGLPRSRPHLEGVSKLLELKKEARTRSGKALKAR